MSGHTPGPWVAGWNGGKSGPTCPVGRPVVASDGRECLPVGYGDVTVAIVVTQKGEPRAGDLEANARLIASAPDLLAVVQAFALNRASIHTEEPFQGALSKLFDMVDAAIAKATGQ